MYCRQAALWSAMPAGPRFPGRPRSVAALKGLLRFMQHILPGRQQRQIARGRRRHAHLHWQQFASFAAHIIYMLSGYAAPIGHDAWHLR